MINVNYLASFGGLLALFAFVHFFVDWIFQSHAEAMVKHNNAKIRAKHCLIYTVGFIPLMYLLGFQTWEWVAGLNILFWSHFVEDTYIPVFLWAKYVRRPPEMTEPRQGAMKPLVISVSDVIDEGGVLRYPQSPLCAPQYEMLPPDPKAGFADWVQTTMGKILMIAIDQIIHLTFLFPLVWMALN